MCEYRRDWTPLLAIIYRPQMLAFVLLCLLPSFAIAAATTAAMRRLAPRWGLVDQPAARKVHATPTPLGGGVGIVLGVVLPGLAALLAATSPERVGPLLPGEVTALLGGVDLRSGLLLCILAAGLLVAAVGLWDDARDLGWPLRLGVQVAVAVGLVASGVHATVFVDAAWVGQLISVLWIVGLINSFNFLDNMDALSAGIGSIAAALFAVVMLAMGPEPRWLVGGMLLTIVGATAGFLVHNRPPARIFMGDAGSTFLGLMLAVLTLVGTFYAGESTARHVLLAPLCILAVPLYDTVTVVTIRLLAGRSPFRPDKSHFSHRLVELGLSRTSAVLTIHLATLATGLGALLLFRLRTWAEASIVVGLVASVLLIVLILETAGRRSQRAVAESGRSRSETTIVAEDAEVRT